MRLIKKLFIKLGERYQKVSLAICALLLSINVEAKDGVQGLIPMAKDVSNLSDKGVGEGMVILMQKDVLPFFEFGGAAIILGFALNGLWSGYREYQRERDLTPLKHAIFAAVLLIVVGGGLLYLIDMLRQANYIT